MIKAIPLFVGAFLAILPAVSPAATWTVTNLDDSGTGSLRNALANAGDGDMIVFDENAITLPGTITLSTGYLYLAASVTIEGPALAADGTPRLTIDGDGSSRELLIEAPGEGSPPEVAISNLTFTGGDASTDPSYRSGKGGGIYVEYASLGLTDCRVVGNSAPNRGGGIYVEGGQLEMTRCTVAENLANSEGGTGGGIAFRYGGYYTDSGSVPSRILYSSIENNQADRGGGIAFIYGSSTEYAIEGSLLAGNQASDSGGGIYSLDSTVSLLNATLSGNSAESDGAAYSRTDGEGESSIDFTYCTITENSASSGTGGLHISGSYYSPSTSVLKATIVAFNRLTPAEASPVESDLLATSDSAFTSGDYNVVRAPGTSLPSPAEHDRVGTSFDPYLLPLADNGGLTRTHAIKLNQGASAAANAIPIGFIPDSEVPYDQRGPGFPRRTVPFPNIGCSCAMADIGAFENQTGQIFREEGDYAADDFTLIAECNGDPAMVSMTFRVVDLDGDLISLRVQSPGPGGDTLWTYPGEDPQIPPGTEGKVFTATFPVPHSALTTPYHFTIIVSDHAQVAYTLPAETWVSLTDTTPPLLVVNSSPIVIGTNAGSCSGTPTFADVVDTVTDACDANPIVTFRLAGEPPEAGQPTPPALADFTATDIVVRAEDQSGNFVEANATLQLQDLTPPVLAGLPEGSVTIPADPESCDAAPTTSQIGITASDNCDPSPVLYYRIDGEEADPTTAPPSLPGGTTTTLVVFAEDADGNRSGNAYVDVTVEDQTAPAITLNGSASITLGLGAAFSDPGVTVSDNCDSEPTLVRLVDGLSENDVNTCLPGEYTITYFAIDASENTSVTLTRTVSVEANVTITAPETHSVDVDPTLCAAVVNLPEIVGISGTSSECPIEIGVEVQYPGSESVDSVAFGEVEFPVGDTAVTVSAYLTDGESIQTLASTSFTVSVLDPFDACALNVFWPFAMEVPLTELATDLSGGGFEQYLARVGESRWYKFQAPPGSSIQVLLENLPANYDLVVYTDIAQAYSDLVELLGGDDAEKLLAILGAEAAPEAFSPEAFSPEAFSPEAFSPEAFSPEAFSPEAFSPEAFSPEAFSPEAFSPEAFSPEAFSPEAFSPEAFSPEAFSPEAFSSAQTRSLIGFSAFPGTASEGLRFNTYSRSGTFYIRVRGRNGIFSTATPFSISIQIQKEICKGVSDFNTIPASSPSVSGSPVSLLVWDSSRMSGTPAELSALATSLAQFAGAANGVVVDLASDARINALNTQADANPACPLAKNLVADAIRKLIRAYRTAAPSIADITLVGSDAAIPFFRTSDESLLADEANYFPPVSDNTASQASLRLSQILTQDAYGSSSQLALVTGPYDLPEIPVGRLVESVPEIAAYLDAYRGLFDGSVSTGGVLPTPDSLFVSGYDFLADSAAAVRDVFAAGLSSGSTVDSLIAPADAAPAEGWTATDLANGLLGSRHAINFLSGHFSTSGALAADYTTRFTAPELAASSTDFSFALFMSTGCHSGYSTVDSDAVTGVTEQPDWAQAFARKLAILIAGTGYQYGDTDFVEYSERLYLDVALALRTGDAPVAIGRAVVDAKNKYLMDTPLMRGIHEKALLEMTLYGLPMIKLDLPAPGLAPTTPAPAVTGFSTVTGPGSDFFLVEGDLSITPSLTRVDSTLKVVGSSSTVQVSHYQGANGVVTLPGEPVRPLETRNITNRGFGLPRGIGFRSGTYSDETGFIPLTGAPATEIRGVHGRFESSVFYPVRPWNANHVGVFHGAEQQSSLSVFPGQFMSDGSGSGTGTMRTYGAMGFSVFYCSNLTTAALTNPPAINLVASEIVGSDIVFTVQVAGPVDVGIQEVWITYTGVAGSQHGSWTSLTLTPPSDSALRGVGTWTGVLSGMASEAANLRFIVQAVNGIGVVSMNSNFGRYFAINASTLDEVSTSAAASALVFEGSVPSTGVYRQSVSVSAHLTDAASGDPVGGRLVSFNLGPISASGVTNGSGVATASLLLPATPGGATLAASFAGDADYLASSVSAGFTITKAPTQMSLAGANPPGSLADVLVRLAATDGTPLKEKTVLFVVSGASETFAVSAITDGAGQARIVHAEPSDPSFEVHVYFGQIVNVPGIGTVPLGDTLYGPSDVSVSIVGTPASGLVFADEKVDANYNDRRAPGASRNNRGLGRIDLSSTLRFSDPLFDPGSLVASRHRVQAHVTTSLSGQSLFDGDVTLVAAGPIWTGSARIGGTNTFLLITWLPEFFDSSLSDPSGPTVASTSISSKLTLLDYSPVPGTYTTTIGSGADQAVVTVKNGRITQITGGYRPRNRVLPAGRSAVVALPFALSPGDAVVTTGSVQQNVVVTLGENYFRATGKLVARVNPPARSGPLFDDTPAVFGFELTLGTDSGVPSQAGELVVGDATKPWTRETTNRRIRTSP